MILQIGRLNTLSGEPLGIRLRAGQHTKDYPFPDYWAKYPGRAYSWEIWLAFGGSGALRPPAWRDFHIGFRRGRG